MSDDTEKHKAELEKFSRLIGRYAQSRSLGLWIGSAVVFIDAMVMVGAIELAWYIIEKGDSGWWVPLAFGVLWVIVTAVALIRYEKKLDYGFYDKQDGRVEVKKEKIPIWAFCAFVLTVFGPVILNFRGFLSSRWGLTISLTFVGLFSFYSSKKHRDRAYGVLFGGLCLMLGTATALGIPVPLTDVGHQKSYLLALFLYSAVASLATAVVVHIYNRAVLRKIKQMKLFEEWQGSEADTQ